MKKLVYGIFILTALSAFITVTQISCEKIVAQPNTSSRQSSANLILLAKNVATDFTTVDSSGKTVTSKIFSVDYYTLNIDGSNLQKVPIQLPANLLIWNDGHLTPDGKTIVFNVLDNLGPASSEEVKSYIYSCSLDGSNLKKLADGDYSIQGIY